MGEQHASAVGKVFDIRRFSTHDGEGIRTTVFLKGCPLRCLWCQNPEGISLETHLLLLRSRCIRCGTCAAASSAVLLDEEGYPILEAVSPADFDTLVDCCPSGAIVQDCRELTAKQVMDEVSRDRVFFRHGGGVTFSGGEPFLQFPFLMALLEEAKARGIHTAVESCLQTPRQQLEQALPLIDRLYADLKILDPEVHMAGTNSPNHQILENLRMVLSGEASGKVIVRTPLIPGYTDSEANIRGIADFLYRCNPETRYELLNYNPLAEAKYAHMDYPYCFPPGENPKPYTKSQMEVFRGYARESGLVHLIAE